MAARRDLKQRRTRWCAFGDAFRGLAFLFASQCHARWHLVASLVAAVLGWSLRISRGEWLAVIAAISAVIITEALNTAIEQLGDAVSPEENPKIGRAKDLAAGAVLLAAIAAAAVGATIFLPRIAALL